MRAGQKLMVPREADGADGRTRRSGPVPVAESRRVAAASRPDGGAVGGVESKRRHAVIYEVKRGDTLSSIARGFQTTVAALQTWNRLASSH